MRKKFLSCIIIFVLTLTMIMGTLVGCDVESEDIATPLSAPTNVRVENNVVKWTSVSNATSYLVQIGDDTNQETVSN